MNKLVLLALLSGSLTAWAAPSTIAYFVDAYGGAYSFDWVTGVLVNSADIPQPWEPVFSWDNRTLLVPTLTPNLYSIDPDTFAATAHLVGSDPTGSGSATFFPTGPAVFSPTAPLIYIVDFEGVLETICGITYRVLGGLGLNGANVQDMVMSSDGAYIYALDNTVNGPRILVISTSPMKIVAKVPLSPLPLANGSFGLSFALSPDGRFIYAPYFDSTGRSASLAIFSTESNSVVENIPIPAAFGTEVLKTVVSPDGKNLYSLGSYDYSNTGDNYEPIIVFNTATRHMGLLTKIPVGYFGGSSMAIIPDGSILLVTDHVHIWEVSPTTGDVLASLPEYLGQYEFITGLTTPHPAIAKTGPEVMSLNVLYGTEAYNVIGSHRTRLPWQITGIRAVFSEPIASASAGSLQGATVTSFSGLGTTTLTWNITPISNGTTYIQLLATGPTGIRGASDDPLAGGAGYQHSLKVLAGDFNDDGAVNAADITGLLNAGTQPYDTFADINGDGRSGDLADINKASAYVGETNH